MGEAARIMEIEEAPNLRAQFVERITSAWHKSREKIIALGNTLIEAKKALPHGQFTAMIEQDLPFTAEHARRFMRIAADPRLANRTSSSDLPETVNAMDQLRRLNDEQFEAAIGRGQIHVAMTVKDARELVRSMAKPHRPGALETYEPPSRPAGQGATTASEVMWLFSNARKAQGISQAEVDARVGHAEGLTSKYEIPHMDVGRMPSLKALCEMCQAIGYVIILAPARSA